MSSKVILASSSPYRKKLLEQLGVSFEVHNPKFDEKSIKPGSLPPAEFALSLAEGKAKSLLGLFPKDIIIGCDQICVVQGEILGKPGTKDGAVEQLKKLNGKTHELLTAVVVLNDNIAHRHVDQTLLTLRKLEDEQIVSYVDRDDPVQSAGSYKIEQGGITLFERIQSDDHTAIVGLPLLKLVEILTKLGLKLP